MTRYVPWRPSRVACAVRTATVVMPIRWMACWVSRSCLTAEPGMDVTVAGGGSSWALATLQPVSRAAATAAEAREAGLLLSMDGFPSVLRSVVSRGWERPAGGSWRYWPLAPGAGQPGAPAGRPVPPAEVPPVPAGGLAAP